MKENLKPFLIKLVAITIAVIVVINIVFNVLLGERLEKIDKIISLSDSKTRSDIKQKIRSEISKGLEKDKILSDEDKILFYRLFKKIQKEFSDLDKNNIE
jgi:pyruvate/oxaloacetate carboxyltransferase